MKKDTLIQKINKMETDVRKLAKGGPIDRQLAAIKKMKQWVERNWAEMLKPFGAEIESLMEELAPYQKKDEDKVQMNMQEMATYATLIATYNLYAQFHTLVYPTVRNAQLAQEDRARYATNRS